MIDNATGSIAATRAADFDRQLVLAFGPMTPAALMAELKLIDDIEAAKAADRRRVAAACEGRTLLVGSADIERGRR